MNAYYSLNDTIGALKEAEIVFARAHRLLAVWTISTAEIEIKYMLGESQYQYACIVNGIRLRLKELSTPLEAYVDACEIEADVISIADTPAKINHLLKDTAGKRTYFEGLRSQVDPDIDGPTYKYLSDWLQIIETVHASLQEAANLLQVGNWLPDQHAGSTSLQHELVAEKPARDGRFRYNEAGDKPPADENVREFTLRVLNNAIVNLEIATVEACSRLIVEFPESPWEFKMDMSRQVWDEVRHAKAFGRRVQELGGELGYAESNLDLWNMATGQSLPVRLAIHQRIGEWIGVDGALWLTGVLAQKGDHETSRIIEYVSRDEMTHVGFGNKWIRHFCPSPAEVEEVHNKAVVIRNKQNRNVNAPHPFPINEWACELSGFTKEEITQLKIQFRTMEPVEEKA